MLVHLGLLCVVETDGEGLHFVLVNLVPEVVIQHGLLCLDLLKLLLTRRQVSIEPVRQLVSLEDTLREVDGHILEPTLPGAGPVRAVDEELVN